MKKRKQQIPMQDFRAGFVPKSFNKEKRTVEVVWTTGAKVLRSPWWGEAYYEELQVDEKAVRLDRLNSGAPLLNNHSSYSLEDVIGVVESAELRDGKGYATVRLSERPEIAGLIKDIEDGIIRNISVGYAVHRYEKVNAPEGVEMADETPTYRATDWEPMELSFVGIPADAKAQSRNQTALFECEIINKNERGESMEPKETLDENASPSTTTEEQTVVTPADGEQQANVEDASVDGSASVQEGERNQPNQDEIRALEIKRQDEIRKAVRTANLAESFADDLVKDAKCDINQARAKIFEELEKRTSTTTNNIRIDGGTMDQKQQRREAATRVLLNQFDAKKHKLENGDGEIRAHGILGMAKRILEMEGVRGAAFMSPSEVATRALHHTSDFPAILENVANKTLRAAYDAAPNTFAPFVSIKSVSDFKETSSLMLSQGSKLEKVNESGEVKAGTLQESKEKNKVETFGKIVGLTRQAIINDDMGAFTAIPAGLGLRAKQKENEIFWAMILANKVMAETGLGLFHATHKNLGTASAIDIAALGKARAAMRSMLDLDKQPINITPSFLVVPTALETLADQFVSQITPNQNGQVNPFAGRLQVIAEPFLDVQSGAIPWFVFADAGKVPMAEMLLLDGQGPRIEVKQGFEIEGAQTKIVYDFGMTLLDYRGFYKNPGVV